jgi:hypothetical protein
VHTNKVSTAPQGFRCPWLCSPTAAVLPFTSEG